MKNKLHRTRKTAITAALLTLLLALSAFSTVHSETAPHTIFIQPDGSISPENVPIRRDGNTYTFTGNIYATILIQKGNIIIDGAGYTLQGAYNGTQKDADVFTIGLGPDQTSNRTLPWTVGIDETSGSIEGLTIKNLNIKYFDIGMYVWTTNNTVTGNAVTENIVGILLSGSNNTITRNCITNNAEGIFFGTNEPEEIPLNLTVSQNSFSNNTRHLSGCVCKEYNTSEPPHTWDNGAEGNYWNDYNGTDADGDGIGDTPYVLDIQNLDRYPLMQDPVAPPTAAPNLPVEIIVSAVAVPAIVLVGVAAFRRKKKAKP
jgi:parallel beta-helix repeat protein